MLSSSALPAHERSEEEHELNRHTLLNFHLRNRWKEKHIKKPSANKVEIVLYPLASYDLAVPGFTLFADEVKSTGTLRNES